MFRASVRTPKQGQYAPHLAAAKVFASQPGLRAERAQHVDGHEPATGRLASCRRFVFFAPGAQRARAAARVGFNRGRSPKEILTSPH